MRRFKKATIKDVASKAGVSLTTVSLFVNGKEDVCSSVTAQRIRQVVKDLNYTPSSLVGSVHHRLRSTFGVCMSLPMNSDLHYGGAFFEQLWRGILIEVDKCDYSILSYPVSVREGVSCDPFWDGRVDGVLFFAHSYAESRPAQIAEAGLPVVLLNRSHGIPAGCGAAYANDAEVVNLVLSHLWDLGHRRIAHIAGPVEQSLIMSSKGHWVDDAALRRLLAYEDWMGERAVLLPHLIGYADDWDPKHVPQILADWMALPEPPTAIFCANDMLAIATVTEAKRLGISVPGDLSVVGVDNLPGNNEISLTTVDVPIEEVGREAVQALYRILHGAPMEQCHQVVSGAKLVVKNTTAPPKSQR